MFLPLDITSFFPRLISSAHFTHSESQGGAWVSLGFLNVTESTALKDSVHNLQTNPCLLMKAYMHMTDDGSICIPQNIKGGK